MPKLYVEMDPPRGGSISFIMDSTEKGCGLEALGEVETTISGEVRAVKRAKTKKRVIFIYYDG